MKLIFLCGSLEPGRDGVGDYTRRLAAQLILLGCKCWIAAINDQHCGKNESGVQDSVPVLRLRADVSWEYRIHTIQAWISEIAPDWISLQFVPYAFHSKGLPILLIRNFNRLVPGVKWHVMFHELWIGMEHGAPWRQRLLGEVQKLLIKKLLSEISPTAISTHADLYLRHLQDLGYKPTTMALFGNISPNFKVHHSDLSNGSVLDFIIFGGIHLGAPVAEFSRDCAEYASTSGRNVRLTLAGRCGSGQRVWEEAWRAVGLEVIIKGELPAEEISRLLHAASCGIATTPLALIQKSSAAASMIEHSLPVISVAPKWFPRGIGPSIIPHGIFDYRELPFAEMIESAEIAKISTIGVSSVAQQFVQVLNE